MSRKITLTRADTITMTEHAPLMRLMAWLSPVFPTGAFAYSAGLEQAAAQASICKEDDLLQWLQGLIDIGFIRNDAILMALSWRAGQGEDWLEETARLSELAEAMGESFERQQETRNQGEAFCQAARVWPGLEALPEKLALPVATGLATSRSGLALDTALQAFINASVVNQVQAAIRLSLCGQFGAARVLACLEPAMIKLARKAGAASEDDLGSASFVANIACMNHETLQPRLFLS